MRIAFSALLLLLLGTAAEAAQDPKTVPTPVRVAPLPAGEHWRLIFPGRVESIDGEWGLPAALPKELLAVWYWSEAVAPVRLLPAQLVSFAPRPEREDFVYRRSAPVAKNKTAPQRPPAVLIAGPVEIWREVPEDLLPRWPWPAEHAEIHLPRPAGSHWQARLLDGDRGSFWISPPRSAKALSLAGIPAADRQVAAVGRDGEPLPELKVEILRPAAPDKTRPLLAFFQEAKSGRVKIPSLPDGEPIVAVVKAPGYVPATWQGLPSSLPEIFRLEAGARVGGRLIDGEGRPVAGLQILLETWLPGPFPTYLMRGADSGAGGGFTLEALPAGKARLLTRGGAGGFAPLSRDLEVTERGIELGDLVLVRGERVLLLIADPSGLPIAGAAVTPAGALQPSAADAEGRVALDGIAGSQPLELAIEAEGFLPKKTQLHPPFQPSNEIRLEAAFVVEGLFLDEEGRPVESGTIAASDGRRTISRPLDGAGIFEFRLPVDRAFELRLASAAGGEVRRALEKGRPGERRQLGELRASPARRVAGRLLAAADLAPVAGGRIWLPRPGADHEATAFHFGDLLEAASGADGSFELRGLPAGGATLRIDAPGFARLTVSLPSGGENERVELGDIELSAGAELEVVAPAARDGASARLDLGGRWQELDMLETTIYEGTAIFRQAPPGSALLTVIDGGRLLCEKRVTVPEAGRISADCEQDKPRVSGQVTLGGRSSGAGRLIFAAPSSDAPQIIRRQATPGGLANDRIYGAGRPQVEVAVDSAGRFVSEELLPGRWQASWLAGASSFAGSLEVEIAAAAETRLDLDFPSFALRGRVVDREGDAVTGARVRQLERGLLTESGENGEFLLEGVAAGASWLVAEKEGERSPNTRVVVEPDGATEEVLLVLGEPERRGQVMVRVTLPGGGPAAGALVFLETAEGAQHLGTADSQGLATFELTPPYPGQLRAGAFAAGRLGLGDFLPFAEEMESLELPLEASGAALRLLAKNRTRPAIETRGWNLSWWLGRLGRLPIAEADRELTIEGLPPGPYRGQLGDQAFAVVLLPGEGVLIEEKR